MTSMHTRRPPIDFRFVGCTWYRPASLMAPVDQALDWAIPVGEDLEGLILREMKQRDVDAFFAQASGSDVLRWLEQVKAAVQNKDVLMLAAMVALLDQVAKPGSVLFSPRPGPERTVAEQERIVICRRQSNQSPWIGRPKEGGEAQ